MPTNQISPFAEGVGANVEDPTAWAANPVRQAGFQAGTASSAQFNTVWRQSAFVATMVAQFISDTLNQDVLDNSDIAGLEEQFEAALFGLMAAGNVRFVRDTGTADALVVTPDPEVPAWVDGLTLLVVKGVAFNRTTTPTIKPGTLAAKTIVKKDGVTPVQARDLPAGVLIPMTYDLSLDKVRLWNNAPSDVKQKVTADLTLYVRNDGNDGNDGLTNNAGGAYQTLAGLWATAGSLYDFNGFNLNIVIGQAGTYAGALFQGNLTAKTVSIAGSGNTYIISDVAIGPARACLWAAGVSLSPSNLLLEYTYNGSNLNTEAAMVMSQGGVINSTNITTQLDHTRANYVDVLSQNNGLGNIVGLTLNGGNSRLAFLQSHLNGELSISGVVTVGAGTTVTSGFAQCDNFSSLYAFNATFAGSTPTGPRFSVSNMSLINTAGGGANFLPGSSPGNTTPGVASSTLGLYV